MITDLIEKVKTFLKANQKDLYLASLVFLVSVASFGLGRLSAIWPVKEPIQIIDQNDKIDESASASMKTYDFTESRQSRDDSSPSSISSPQGNFVASKNGSSYHYPWCPGAKRIKDENKIWFQTEEKAKRAGYKPAGNCPGL